eukprot:8221090-Lingulodinium_polyedra.AAC.1
MVLPVPQPSLRPSDAATLRCSSPCPAAERSSPSTEATTEASTTLVPSSACPLLLCPTHC